MNRTRRPVPEAKGDSLPRRSSFEGSTPGCHKRQRSLSRAGCHLRKSLRLGRWQPLRRRRQSAQGNMAHCGYCAHCRRSIRLGHWALGVGAVMAPKLFLELVTQGRGGRATLAGVLLHRLVFFLHVLGPDGERDFAILAVDRDDLGLDAVAVLQYGTRVFDAIARYIGGAQITFYLVGELDY